MPAALPPRVVLAPPLLAPRVVLAPPGAVLVEAAFLLLPLHAANPTMTPATTIPLLMQLFRMTAGYRLFGLSGVTVRLGVRDGVTIPSTFKTVG